MGLRKEVRKFMDDMRLALVKNNTVIQEQGRMILLLERQNKELLDRLMARDLPELKTWEPVSYSKEPTMDFDLTDEELSGTVVPGLDESKEE
jgi:hypothetical protein